MKKIYISLIFLIALSFSGSACVDYHPDQPIITAYIDSIDCGQFLIEVTNLQLAQGPAGAFCSCGINNLFDGPINYVAFLDSISGAPVPGFEWFNFSEASGIAWDEASGGIDWNGWIAEVNENGLLNVAVTLIIRGETGYSDCDSFLETFIEGSTSFSIGTDEWDGESEDLADTHQDISDWTISEDNISFQHPNYFEDFDEWIFSFPFNIEQTSKLNLAFYPNPASTQIILKHAEPNATLEIYGLTGQRVAQQIVSVKNEIIDVSDLPKGIYLVHYRTSNAEQTKRLIIN